MFLILLLINLKSPNAKAITINGKIKYDIPDKNIIRKILYLDIELTKNRLIGVDEAISDNPTITLSGEFNTAVEDIIKHWSDY